MRIFSRTMLVLGLLMGFGMSAMATEIVWTFNDVTFSNGNTASGYFETNASATAIDSFSINISGPTLGSDFWATTMANTYLSNSPQEIGAANPGWTEYMDLYLNIAHPLTSAGGVIPIASGYDCPGCGVLVTAGHTPTLNGLVVPEPASMMLLGSGLLALGGAVRRKFQM